MSGNLETQGLSHDPEMARYSTVAIMLHWLIAALIAYQLFVGFFLMAPFETLAPEERAGAFALIQNHKSIGLTVLALSLARLAWRFWRPAPPAPAAMPGWQKGLSGVSHALLYAFMIGAPLSGWAMATTSVEYSMVPTLYFDWFVAPHLPGLRDLQGADKAAADAAFHTAHAAIAWAMVGLLALHVVAAVKHHVVDGDAVLARMVPGMQARSGRLGPPLRQAAGWSRAAAFGVVALSAAGLATVYTATAPAGDGARLPPPASTSADPASNATSSAPSWRVDGDESRLGLSAGYSYGSFSGEFETWSASINFDPGALDASRVRVEVDLASISTGDQTVDQAALQAPYFDLNNQPRLAVYEADAFRSGDEPGAYVAVGNLTMLGVSRPLELAFTLAIDGDKATASGAVGVDRMAFSVGQGPGGDHGVSDIIEISFDVAAERAAEPE